MKKFILCLLVLSLVSISTPQKSYAQYVDMPNFTKEYALDAVAYQVAQVMVKKLTQKTVNWINSGFKGNPGYITDPQQFFLNVGDDLASQFLSQAGVNKLCSPFRAQVRLALIQNYVQDNNNYSCTLSILRNNFNAFTQDFTQGGWDAWLEVTQNQQNNPYGAYLASQNSMRLEIAGKQNDFSEQLNRSGGLLDFKRCPRGQEYIDVYQNRKCFVQEETVTPGTIVSEQLTDALGSKWGQLIAADEFNEIITALVGQLIEQVTGNGNGSGLRGASQVNPATGRSLVDEYGTEAQPITNYGPISATQPSINCTSTGGGGGSGGSGTGGTGGSGGSGGSSRCQSTPGSISGLPPWPLGGGGSGGGSCPAYTPNPAQDCTRVRSGDILAILNRFPPSNNGMRAAESALQAAGYYAVILQHPVRLDKFDFGNGMAVDVIVGAVGNAGPLGDDSEGQGWTFNVECACNRDPAGSANPNPPTPLPGTNTYRVDFTISGLGVITDNVDTCQNLSQIASTTCSKNYPRDSYVSVTAIPALGQTFMGWGGACAVFGTGNTCYGNVTGNGAVTATFR